MILQRNYTTSTYLKSFWSEKSALSQDLREGIREGYPEIPQILYKLCPNGIPKEILTYQCQTPHFHNT